MKIGTRKLVFVYFSLIERDAKVSSSKKTPKDIFFWDETILIFNSEP